MKLKKEVKETLIFIGVIATLMLLLAIPTKMGNDAYNDCMSKHNDKNFCHKLME